MAQKNEHFINVAELGRAIKQKRVENNLSLRDVANETNVSASTLSRIENGTGKPDADNIAALTNWLNMPMDRVLKVKTEGDDRKSVVYFPTEPTPDIILAHLRADPNLDEKTAQALGELFRVAYHQMSKPQNSQDKKEDK